MASRAPLLLLTIFFSVNQALAFPLSVKHTLGSFGGPRVTLPELAFYSISIAGKPRIVHLASMFSCIPLPRPSMGSDLPLTCCGIHPVGNDRDQSLGHLTPSPSYVWPSIYPSLYPVSLASPILSRQCYHTLTSPSCLFSLRCTRCRWPSRACATPCAQGGTCLPNVGISCPLVSASEPPRASRLRLSQRRKLRI